MWNSGAWPLARAPGAGKTRTKWSRLSSATGPSTVRWISAGPTSATRQSSRRPPPKRRRWLVRPRHRKPMLSRCRPMKLLTVRESAGRLGCSEALVYLLCSERRVAHVRLGTGRGTIRIAEEELDEFLKNSRIDAHSLGKGLKHIRAK